jgi:hypothetical protein
MSNFTAKEQESFYQRKLNTYHYQVSSRNATGPSNTAGLFEFDIPNFAFPTHQASHIAIFKLKDFWVVNQGSKANNRASGSLAVDISAFTLNIQGLGTRGMIFSNTGAELNAGGTANKLSLNPSCKIEVINKYGQIDTGGILGLQVVSGSDDTEFEFVCSNPSGQHISVQVINAETGAQIPDGDEYFSMLRFDIEVILPEISSGNV